MAGLEGAEPAPAPHLGDGLTPSLTVLLICDRATVLWRHRRHFYLFKHVQHGTQNIQNDCHQLLCDSIRAHQIRFRPGLRSDPAGGAYSAPRAPYLVEGGYTSKGKTRGGKGKGEWKAKGRGKEGRGMGGTNPPFVNFWIRPWSYNVNDVSAPSFIISTS